ncbi:hypothetical protein HYH03_015824 [Edaphochlamys debaryana]|nr:hypothetical protein HYH03_015824 [Edaphochlamys debaryana]|eukprot:KAG2485446.1 hypothetical protein HYH03_015824 [Edaphochlamys debaryana]
MKELAYSRAAEVAWYFPCSREQYRLTGELDVVDGTTTEPNLIKARRRGWATMSDSARQQWVWPQPGAPRDNDPAVWTKRAPGPDEPPVDTFILLVLRVEEVELLVLSSPSTCTHYSREVGPDGNYFWLEESLNP